MAPDLLKAFGVRTNLAALVAAWAALAAVACGPSTGALLEVRGPSEAIVGEEFRLSLRASHAAELGFDAETWYLGRSTRPTLTQLYGEGIFRWTPLGEDVGSVRFTLTATEHGVTSRVPFDVEVIPPLATMVFRQPLGAGTTFDPSVDCVVISLAVDNASASTVSFSGGQDWPESAIIEQTGLLTGLVHFCPSEADLVGDPLFPLDIVAEDPFGNRVQKRYVLVPEINP